MVLDVFRLKGDEALIRYWQPVLLRGWLRPLTRRGGYFVYYRRDASAVSLYVNLIKAVFIGVIMSTIMYRIFNLKLR